MNSNTTSPAPATNGATGNRQLAFPGAWIRPGQAPAWLAYGTAVFLPTLMVWAQWLLDWRWPPQILLVVPIAVGAYLGGLGAGIISTGIAAVGGRYLAELPHLELGLQPGFGQLPWLALTGVGLLLSSLSEVLHRARRRLEFNEITLRNVQQIGKIGTWEWDLVSDRLRWSEQMYRIFARDEALPPVPHNELQGYFSTESWTRFVAAMEDVRSTGKPFECDVLVQRGEGNSVCVTARGGALRDGLGNIVKLFGTMVDISERKAAEQQREASVILLQGVLDTVLEGIVTMDETACILSFNPAAERIFGYRMDEVIGKSIDCLMPDPYRSAHHKYLGNYLESGRRKIIGIGREVEGQRKDGSTFPLDLAVDELRINKRRVFVGAVRDITERRRAEDELKSSQAQIRAYAQHLDAAVEAERLRMAREIHDDLGQALTSIKMDLAALRRRLKPGLSDTDIQDLEHRLNDLTTIADSTISNVRRIATELRPPLLERVGLSRAIQMHCRMFSERSGVYCDTERVHDVKVDEPRAIAVYRIFQEAITNIARHAQASEVTVSLDARNEQLLLEIHNDGKAITATEINDPRSFGLIGMRERARALGGSVEFSGCAGAGTRIRLMVPSC